MRVCLPVTCIVSCSGVGSQAAESEAAAGRPRFGHNMPQSMSGGMCQNAYVIHGQKSSSQFCTNLFGVTNVPGVYALCVVAFGVYSLQKMRYVHGK